MLEIRASIAGFKADGSQEPAALDRNQKAIQESLWKLNPKGGVGGGKFILDDAGYGFARGGFDLPFGVEIECLGPMRTTLALADNSNNHMFIPHKWEAGGTQNAMMWAVKGLTIDIRRSKQSTTAKLCGIYSETNPWNAMPPVGVDGKQVDYGFDPSGLIEDLEVRNADTAVNIVGRSGTRLNRVTAHACLGPGFGCDFDTTFLQCIARFCGSGYDLRLSNNQLSLCLAHNNKTVGYRGRGTYVSLGTCIAHQNGGTSFDFANTVGLSASSLVSYDPGFMNQDVVYGIDLLGAKHANVHGTHKMSGLNPNVVPYRMTTNSGNILSVTKGTVLGPNVIIG